MNEVLDLVRCEERGELKRKTYSEESGKGNTDCHEIGIEELVYLPGRDENTRDVENEV